MKFFTTIGSGIIILFVKPFRDLELALSFSELKSQICQQNGLLK